MDTSIAGLVMLLVWLLIGCLVFWLAVWIVGVMELPSVPRRVVLALVGIIALLVILNRLGIL